MFASFFLDAAEIQGDLESTLTQQFVAQVLYHNLPSNFQFRIFDLRNNLIFSSEFQIFLPHFRRSHLFK